MGGELSTNLLRMGDSVEPGAAFSELSNAPKASETVLLEIMARLESSPLAKLLPDTGIYEHLELGE